MRVSPRRIWSLAPLLLVLVVGCATTGPFLWVHELPTEGDPGTVYRISPRDVISVRVWNQESMSVERARVREDGKISLPFLRDVDAAGLTPAALGEKLQQQLVKLIVDPIVTVTLEEPAALHVSIIGEVANPTAVTLPRPAGVLHAIAAAGGLTAYADKDGIFVLRRLEPGSTAPTRIRFRYRDLTSGGTPASAFELQSGDIVVVE